jgi:hypothetical protein
MTTRKHQNTRVADLEAKQALGKYTPPTIITKIVSPDLSIDRALIRSGPFEGYEFTRSKDETTPLFEARIDREMDVMDKETQAKELGR